MKYEIKTIPYTETFELRQSVMNPEKKILEMKRPGDEEALHLGAFFDDNIIGVASFYETGNKEWRIRGMVLTPEYQRRGIGKALIEHALIDISGIKRIWCNSRVQAVSFYKSLGFKIIPREIISGYWERIRMELII